MRIKFRLTALLAALMVLSVSVFTACGGGSKNDGGQKETEQAAEQEAQAPAEAEPAEAVPQAEADSTAKPAAEDAQAYVKAILDMICTGEYDHSVTITDIESGVDSAQIDTILAAIAAKTGMSEELQGDFIAVLKESFSKCRYTVGDAVPAEDGGYDVTVSIEPLKVYSGSEEKMKEKISERAAELDIPGMTDEEKNNLVYSILIEVIRENIEEPAYGDLQDVVVHYGLLDESNATYGISADESRKIFDILMSTDLD